MLSPHESTLSLRYAIRDHDPVVAVVIPCYRVRKQVLGVIAGIGNEVSAIFAVDDACPEQSGAFIQEHCRDPRLVVIKHELNLGVGGAVITGYRAAIAHGADIIVKLDGDGQMDPALLPRFIAPLVLGRADYAKGNRFYDLEKIGRMPAARLIGNAGLSFMAKLSCGYWNIFDPTNGYTAIHARVASYLPLHNISQRYFFETDMLFRLNTLRAVVEDVPMDAVYGEEDSSLQIFQVMGEFVVKHLRNFGKRIFYNYFLRDVTIASFELLAGAALFLFGLVFGSIQWIVAHSAGTPAPLGTIMLAALPVLLGLQLLLAFLNFDIANVPNRPIGEALPAPLAVAGELSTTARVNAPSSSAATN